MKLINYKNFKLNEEGKFSITRPYESNQIIRIVEEYVGDLTDMIITDATACMGGDLVNFARSCRLINGVEINETNFKLLIINAKRFDCQNVQLFCQDYLKIFTKLKQDIIYMDPPWGGTDYKNKTLIQLKIGDLELWSLIKKIRSVGITKYIFIKVPLNVCLDFIHYDRIDFVFNKNGGESFKILIINLKKEVPVV